LWIKLIFISLVLYYRLRHLQKIDTFI